MDYDEDTLGLLESRGFTKLDDVDEWRGALESVSGPVEISIFFPPSFPFQTPIFRLRRPDLVKKQAHVERDGKICISQDSDAVIDINRPAMVLRDCFERAQTVLNLPTDEESEQLIEEFLAYWSSNAEAHPLFSILSNENASEVFECRFTLNEVERQLVANSREAASEFLSHLEIEAQEATDCFHIKLEKAIYPPPFDSTLTLQQLLECLQRTCNPEDFSAVNEWVRNRDVAATIVLSIPAGDQIIRAAARIAPLRGNLLEQAQKGFRPGKIPKERGSIFKLRQSIFRLGVDSVDLNSLLRRTRGEHQSIKRVAVIGCGSVGSFIAESLCLSGVPEITLIDKERLGSENVYRHLLGFDSVGLPKASAVKRALSKRFPQLQISAYLGDCIDWLDEADKGIGDFDLLVIAVGDETLERRINKAVNETIDRLHVWVEALGLGGHIASFKKGGSPCFECMYATSEEHGPYNMAMLAAPNQSLMRSHVGCAGAFMPFGAQHAQRAAIEVADALRSLSDGAGLKSWRTYDPAFENQGYKLSERGKKLGAGGVSLTSAVDFTRKDCTVCSRA